MLRRAKVSDIDRINILLFQVHKIHASKRPDIFKPGNKKYNDIELVQIINDDNRPIYVYTDENDLVLGYAFCIINEIKNDKSLSDRKELYIDDLCVDETIRGRGIGRKLYNYVVQNAKIRDCHHVTLNVWCLNESAMRFYESIGLKPLKVYMEDIIE